MSYTHRLFEKIITEDNPLPIKQVNKRRLLWEDTTDFNKGTYTDTELNGTGDAVVVRLEEKTNNSDNITYNASSDYTLSDNTKITVDENNSNKASLKVLGGEENNWDYNNSSEYTYTASDIDVIGGEARLNPQETDATFIAMWNYYPDATYAAGSITSTGSTTITGGKLDLSGGSSQHIDFDATSNADNQQAGCINFLVTPNYSSYPGVVQIFTGIQKADGDTTNLVQIQQQTAGDIRAVIIDQNDVVIDSTNYAKWSPSSGTEYEIEYNWDITTGAHRMFIDGTQQGATQTTTGTRSSDIDLLRIGTNAAKTAQPDFFMRNLIIYDAVQHTTDYAPSALKPFLETDPKIVPTTGLVFTTALETFTETATKYGSDDIKYQVSSDDGTNWEWWSGSSWANVSSGQTDSWYYTNESNLSSVVHTNIPTLSSSGTFNYRAFLHSDNGDETPRLDNILASSPLTYSTDDNLYIDTTDDSQIAPATIYEWLSSSITNTTPANTDIRVLFSTDGRVTWQTWSGTTWQAPTSATTRTDATSITDAQTNFNDLALGNGTLDARLFLYTNDSSVTPDVDNILITSEDGFKTTGTYVSNEYNSTYLNLEWGKISFSANELSGNVVISARAGNTSGSLGNYTTLTSGQQSGLTGQYIQWKAEFTGSGVDEGATLDNLYLIFDVPTTQMIKP